MMHVQRFVGMLICGLLHLFDLGAKFMLNKVDMVEVICCFIVL